MVFLCPLALCTAAPGSNPGSNKDALDRLLRATVERGEIPGVVAMVANENAIVYRGAFGKRDVGGSADMTLDTIFRIASMTKPVTSVAAMQLIEQGKLSLDQPARDILPAIGSARLFKKGEADLVPPTTTITIRHLLTHTSGFGYTIFNKDVAAYAQKRGVAPGPAEGPLLFEAGSRWEYGTNTDLLGQIVEKVSGLSLEEYFRKNMFLPLGMTETFFNVPPSLHGRIASTHQRQEDGSLKETPRTPPQPVTSYSGGGGLYATAGDYVKFMQMILRGGAASHGRVLRRKTVSLMTRNQIGALAAGRLDTTRPALANAADFHPGHTDGFGFGFLINADPYERGRGKGSLAWAGVLNTYFWIDPERKVCAVLLMQVLPFFDKHSIPLLRAFEEAVYTGAAR
jgi:CubicO group peptidase (beta-lactamase class C family)